MCWLLHESGDVYVGGLGGVIDVLSGNMCVKRVLILNGVYQVSNDVYRTIQVYGIAWHRDTGDSTRQSKGAPGNVVHTSTVSCLLYSVKTNTDSRERFDRLSVVDLLCCPRGLYHDVIASCHPLTKRWRPLFFYSREDGHPRRVLLHLPPTSCFTGALDHVMMTVHSGRVSRTGDFSDPPNAHVIVFLEDSRRSSLLLLLLLEATTEWDNGKGTEYRHTRLALVATMAGSTTPREWHTKTHGAQLAGKVLRVTRACYEFQPDDVYSRIQKNPVLFTQSCCCLLRRDI